LIYKINLILYVAPDQQNEVEFLLENIDGQGYPTELFETTLIINTSATWLPNSIIKGKVKSKAEKDKTKSYVLDLDEILLNEWELSEDNPNIILFDEKGGVFFTSKEKINEETEDNLLHQITMQIKSKINKGAKQ
jgi:predicted transcriptional regulator